VSAFITMSVTVGSAHLTLSVGVPKGAPAAPGARLLGAADGIRQRTGEVRFRIFQPAHDAVVDSLRKIMEQNEFDTAWAEGDELTADEAIAYAQRGRGDRKRPSSGWESLTPAKHDVVRLVYERLGNKDVAARLFVCIAHGADLSHVYTKLGINTRVQLVQDAVRRAQTSVEWRMHPNRAIGSV
jgi:DNA-binding CsgD family transcriptional regulator